MAAAITDNTKHALRHRLDTRRRDRWPALTKITIRYRGPFAYIAGITSDDDTLPLFRLRHVGSQNQWAFALYLASKDGYENSLLPTGHPTGTPEEALDCAAGLYLNHPTGPTTDTPTNF